MFSRICCLVAIVSCISFAVGDNTPVDDALNDLKHIDETAGKSKPAEAPTDETDSGSSGELSKKNEQISVTDKTATSTTQTPEKLNEKAPILKPSETGASETMKNSNCSTNNGNSSACKLEGQGISGYGGIQSMINNNKPMLMRTFYVIISITGIIIVYFVVRTIRSRRRHSRTKRYGLLSSRDDNLEMAPLDADEDDDDLTVFDINNRK